MRREADDTHDALLQAVVAYTQRHGNADGLAVSSVPGVRMMCVDAQRGALHSTYRPLVCLVLQGAKHLQVGRTDAVCRGGQSVVVAADMPVRGQVLEATHERPYAALAIELDMPLLSELVSSTSPTRVSPALHSITAATEQTLFVQPTEAELHDCGLRLMRLMDQPQALAALLPGLRREVHYWLLAGPHGARLRALSEPQGHVARLARAIGLLRSGFRQRIAVEQLAAAATMSLSAFHRHFKALTSLSPLQYQKRLRLVEARRLMMYEGHKASSAAYDVGYESVPQFTRDYARLFGMPPGRDMRTAQPARGLLTNEPAPGRPRPARHPAAA